jgi:hypothetical protein
LDRNDAHPWSIERSVLDRIVLRCDHQVEAFLGEAARQSQTDAVGRSGHQGERVHRTPLRERRETLPRSAIPEPTITTPRTKCSQSSALSNGTKFAELSLSTTRP